MFKVQYLILFLALVACATPVAAQSGNPDLDLSTASREYSGPQWLSVMIVPDGSGDSLEQAMLPDGSRTSGVVTVQLLDGAGYPAVNYEYQNITLNGADPIFFPCFWGNLANGSTDANGVTEFRDPIRGGGSTSSLAQVRLVGAPLNSSAGLALKFNSPDLNADRHVNLFDIVIFAEDFYGLYNYRSDFLWDGEINLSDVSRMAQHLGAYCP
jgi:hypothetical protein